MTHNAHWPRRWSATLFSLLCAWAGFVSAAPLDPDPGYGAQGRVTFSTGQPQASIGRSVVQVDGKLIVTGARKTQVGGFPGAELFARRFNVDGSPDTAFGSNGEARFSVRGNDAINMITLQGDGRIVLAVWAQEPCITHDLLSGCSNSAGQNAPPVSAVVRLRTDGTLDTTLEGKGFVEAADFYGGYAVAVQPDGKLLLLGTLSIARARIFNWRLARFNPDGTRDAGFNHGETVYSRCQAFGYAVLVQPDGGIIVGGDDGVFHADSAANPGFCIERLLPDGTYDLAFNQGNLRTNFGIDVTLSSLTVLPGGSLLAVGRGIRSTDTPTQHISESGVIAARYAANGVLDPGYGNGGTVFLPMASSAVSFLVDGSAVYEAGSSNYFFVDFTFARDGGWVGAGYQYPVPFNGPGPEQYRGVFVKVNANGSVDAAFGLNGIARGSYSAARPADFLRDLEDRWLLVSTTPLPDLNTGGLIERYRGERPDSVPVIEFYNFDLKHYFITSNMAEAAAIDAGAAGRGWQRTGESFRAWQPVDFALNGVPQLAQALCRFYGTPGRGPNSHFLSINKFECDLVRKDPGWLFEGFAFYAYAPLTTPAAAGCPGGLPPVYRAYNDRFAQNDSNHRYTTNVATYQQIQQLGWIGEGVVFCAASQ